MAKLVELKSLGGFNFVRPDRVMAVQTTATGSTVVVLEGGVVVNSSEGTKAIAERLEAAMLAERASASVGNLSVMADGTMNGM